MPRRKTRWKKICADCGWGIGDPVKHLVNFHAEAIYEPPIRVPRIGDADWPPDARLACSCCREGHPHLEHAARCSRRFCIRRQVAALEARRPDPLGALRALHLAATLLQAPAEDS